MISNTRGRGNTLITFFIGALIFGGFAFAYIGAKIYKSANQGVPPARLQHLKRGIDVTEWFIYADRSKYQPVAAFQNAVTTEASRIRSLGFDHVRLSVDPDLPTRDSKFFANLRFTLDTLFAKDLAVIVDIHPNAGFFTFSESLAKDPASLERFSALWIELAGFFARFNEDLLFLQILNEPTIKEREVWYGIQEKLAAVIRGKAPRHTLIAMGANYSSLDELLAMTPLKDKNVIYDFHYYAPGIFTHQQATWAVPYYGRLKDVPYPFGPEHSAMIRAQIPKHDKDALRQFQERYEGQRWDGARIEGLLKQAHEWSLKWKVPVLCGEFGAYRKNTQSKYRAAWVRDVRTALEKFGIGWTFWNYEGDFGLMTENGGTLTADPLVLQGLGLQ